MDKYTSDDCTKIRTYVGDDGKLHFVDSEGADSVLNFSKDTSNSELSLTVGKTTIINSGIAIIVSFFGYSDGNLNCGDYTSVKINDSVSATRLKQKAMCFYANSQYNHNWVDVWVANVIEGDVISSKNSTIWVLN